MERGRGASGAERLETEASERQAAEVRTGGSGDPGKGIICDGGTMRNEIR